MHPTEASIAIRPRSSWEALDLGVLLARQHRRLLMLSWAAISLPVLALLSAVLRDYPSMALLLFWWLKPAFERLPLYILSQSLFFETPTLGQALRQWPRLLRPQLLASLTWRRTSLSRSFTLPVQQLEARAGRERQRRTRVLSGGDRRAARWLTLVGLHMEAVLWGGLMVLLYALLPEQFTARLSWQTLLAEAADDWLWLEHLSNLLYALVLIVWEPIYVACGFTLYLNRRTSLEAWDIERVLRRLRHRLGSAALLLLAVGIAGLPLISPVQAAEPPPAVSPQSPRLLNQAVDSQTAQQAIKAILDRPPFRHAQTVTRWRLDARPTDRTATRQPWLDAQLVANLARGFEALLWAGLSLAVTLLAWRYRDWLRTFVGRQTPAPRPPAARPEQLFGLDLSHSSLPVDIATSAERLWQVDPRNAMGLLYRALLNRLSSEHQIPLSSADTEGQVLDRVTRLGQPALIDYSTRLTRHWLNLAYGHLPPPAQAREELCQGWRELFDRRTGP